MKIQALTGITNPRQLGYLAYLASIPSWLDVCERVVVVDGHSDDGSVELLERRLGGMMDRVSVVRTPQTYWAKDHRFYIGQLDTGWHDAVDRIDADWLIITNADYVFDRAGDLERSLAAADDSYIARYKRFKIVGGQKLYDKRGYAVNLRRLRAHGMKLRYGVTPEGLFSDFPIIPSEKAGIFDAGAGCVKIFYRGNPLEITGEIDIECGVYGHFFFTEDQCLSKCARWSNAISRYYGTHLLTNLEHRLQQGLFFGQGSLNRESQLALPHPPGIKTLIEEYWSPDWIGNRDRISPAWLEPAATLSRRVGRIADKALRLSGLRGLVDYVRWTPLSSDEVYVADMAAIYDKQDRFLGRPERRGASGA